MAITKEKLIEAISDFIIDDIAKDIRDASVKAMAMATGKIIKKSPELVDRILGNSYVSAILSEEDGLYDTDTVEEIINEIVTEQGKIILVIPSIPLIHPTETKIGLTNQDFEKMFARFKNV